MDTKLREYGILVYSFLLMVCGWRDEAGELAFSEMLEFGNLKGTPQRKESAEFRGDLPQ